MKSVEISFGGRRVSGLASWWRLGALSLVAGVFMAGSAMAGVCACDGDVDGNGVVNPDDLRCLVAGIADPFACTGGDVNCDGTIDYCDFAALECLIGGGGAACCTIPCGACCASCKSLDPVGGASVFYCRQTTDVGCAAGVSPNAGAFCPPGVYSGDGTSCLPSPCDCNGNGVPDGDDIDPTDPDGNGVVSGDCDNDGTPDECQGPDPSTVGACCIPGLGCANTDDATCAGQSGVFSGFCTSCDVQNIGLILEPSGEIFVHVIGPQTGGDCTNPTPEGPCPGVFIDAWQSPPAGAMCHNFGAIGANPIPADFFGPGSDPFSGTVCLQGVPLGDPNFPGADTLIQRTADPFDRCALPSTTPQTVAIEVVALNLVSVAPIVVTFNGGMNPEPWDVQVDLSTVPVPALGSLTATKTHCNGGTYNSVLNVQPRFTFTQVNAPNGTAVLDTGVAGDAPIQLVQSVDAPWVHDVAPQLGLVIDACSDFHGGISEANPKLSCDCNNNAIRDKCDIEAGATDANQDGVPDVCQSGIPTASEWGLAIMVIALLTGGTIVFRRRRPVTQ